MIETISVITKRYGVSTRTLRYYEQIGLLPSQKEQDYAYRVYNKASIRRLEQILILRKLRIPLKQIMKLLGDVDTQEALEILRQTLRDMDGELTALSTVRSVLGVLIKRIQSSSRLSFEEEWFQDQGLKCMLSLLHAKPKEWVHQKEENSMQELNQANEALNRLQDKDVRILYLPPATVASAHYIGQDPENHASEMLGAFVKGHKLFEIKPDARVFGFNHPSPKQEGQTYGYELWVTIPHDMEVPAPLTKQQFPGGFYAAHTIAMGDFHEWGWLWEWVKNSDAYADNGVDDQGERMNGLLEEHLNQAYDYTNGTPEVQQIDLLYPIRKK